MSNLGRETIKHLLKETVKIIPLYTSTIDEENIFKTLEENPELALSIIESYHLLGEKIPIPVLGFRYLIPIGLVEVGENLLTIFAALSELETMTGRYKRLRNFHPALHVIPLNALHYITGENIQLPTAIIKDYHKNMKIPTLNTIRQIIYLPTLYEIFANSENRGTHYVNAAACILLLPSSSWERIMDLPSKTISLLHNVTEKLPIRKLTIYNQSKNNITVESYENDIYMPNLASIDLILLPLKEDVILLPSTRNGEPIIIPNNLKKKALLDIYPTPATFIETLAKIFTHLYEARPNILLEALRTILEKYRAPLIVKDFRKLLEQETISRLTREEHNSVRSLLEKFILEVPYMRKVRKYSIPLGKNVTCLEFDENEGRIYLR